jgi:hypothetical protein
MRRTTVYLQDELKAALERTAAAEGRSEAEVVRLALTAATAEHSYPRPRLPLFESGDETGRAGGRGARARLRRVILLDTSGLLAALDASQRQHESAAASLAAARRPLLLSPFALAELDYLIASR